MTMDVNHPCASAITRTAGPPPQVPERSPRNDVCYELCRGRRAARITRVAGHVGAAFDRHGRDTPNVGAVLADRTVGGEFAGVRHVRNRHARPTVAVGKRIGHAPLAIAVSGEVGEDEKRVVVEQTAQQRLEQLRVAARKKATADELDGGRELRVAAAPVGGAVTGGAQLRPLRARSCRTGRSCPRRPPRAARRSRRRACRS